MKVVLFFLFKFCRCFLLFYLFIYLFILWRVITSPSVSFDRLTLTSREKKGLYKFQTRMFSANIRIEVKK